MKKAFLIAIFISSFSFAQRFETNANPKVSEIQKNFKFKHYSKNLLSDFSKRIIEEPDETVTVFEYIPGEIIGWTNHRGSYTSSVVFKIVKNKLVEINTLPNDQKFFKTLSKYGPKNSYFKLNSINGRIYDPEFVKKQKDGKYVLSVDLLAYENGTEDDSSDGSGIYELEYETSDFKNFKPLRIKNSEFRSVKWTTIK